MKNVLWIIVLVGLTGAYILAWQGALAARKRNFLQHQHHMMLSGILVTVWLCAYSTKRWLFGGEVFPGSPLLYVRVYLPILILHISCALLTILLGIWNLSTGPNSLSTPGSPMALVGGASHRLRGQWLMGIFTITMVTAYIVYGLLIWAGPS